MSEVFKRCQCGTKYTEKICPSCKAQRAAEKAAKKTDES